MAGRARSKKVLKSKRKTKTVSRRKVKAKTVSKRNVNKKSSKKLSKSKKLIKEHLKRGKNKGGGMFSATYRPPRYYPRPQPNASYDSQKKKDDEEKKAKKEHCHKRTNQDECTNTTASKKAWTLGSKNFAKPFLVDYKC